MPTIIEPPAVHVEYVAPAACPPVASFIGGLSARGVRVTDAEGARPLSASIRGNASDGYVGTVSVGVGGAERHVQGRVCSEVTSALAFVASLEVEAIEREAASQKDPSGPDEPKDTLPKDTLPKGTLPKDVQPKDSSGSASVLASLDLGAGAAAVAGPLPAAAFAVPLFVEAGFATAASIPLHLRLRFQQVGQNASTPTYGAQFTLTTGSVELSGMVLESGRFRAFGGIRIDAGTLAAAGTQITPALRSSRPWVAVGPDVRARLVIAGPFFAELDVGIPFALTRDRFFVEPSTTVHRPGVVGAAGALDLGFSLF